MQKQKEENILPLSGKETLVLEILLRQNSEMYGLELVAESKKQLKRGTVYVTLSRMEDKGYISARVDPSENLSGTPRRLYRVTGHGQKVFRAWQVYQRAFVAARPLPEGA